MPNVMLTLLSVCVGGGGLGYMPTGWPGYSLTDHRRMLCAWEDSQITIFHGGGSTGRRETAQHLV